LDIGIWMQPEVLEHKLEARTERNTEQAWNLYRWPTGFKEGEDNRLFVASRGAWRGHFKITGALYTRTGSRAEYTLLFDTATWTPIELPLPVKRFRGFTKRVPTRLPDGSVLPRDATNPSTPASSAGR
jgi:hypothetical protein